MKGGKMKEILAMKYVPSKQHPSALAMALSRLCPYVIKLMCIRSADKSARNFAPLAFSRRTCTCTYHSDLIIPYESPLKSRRYNENIIPFFTRGGRIGATYSFAITYYFIL